MAYLYSLNSSDKTFIKILNVLYHLYKEYLDLIHYWSLDSKLMENNFVLIDEIRNIQIKHKNVRKLIVLSIIAV